MRWPVIAIPSLCVLNYKGLRNTWSINCYTDSKQHAEQFAPVCRVVYAKTTVERTCSAYTIPFTTFRTLRTIWGHLRCRREGKLEKMDSERRI